MWLVVWVGEGTHKECKFTVQCPHFSEINAAKRHTVWLKGSDGGKKAAADQTSTMHTDIWGLKIRFLERTTSRVDRLAAPGLHLTSRAPYALLGILGYSWWPDGSHALHVADAEQKVPLDIDKHHSEDRPVLVISRFGTRERLLRRGNADGERRLERNRRYVAWPL